MSDTLYDTVPYPSHPLPQTHPARLAAIARLHGIEAASPRRCRVLEVGGGDGANLIPLAEAYPESTFVGIDLSQSAVAQGEEIRSRLGFNNLTLLARDICEGIESDEPFDYIIAHGFYSWVPAFVREAFLALCQKHLAPQGVVYISYNAMPGCHLRKLTQEMMRFHARHIEDPQAKVDQALALIQFLVQGAKEGIYRDFIKHEAEILMNRTERSVIFHDDLSPINDPFSITDFVEQGRQFGFEFLAEADYFEMTCDVFPKETAKVLKDLESRDVLLKEQYLDYLKLRRFRQTLLCRQETTLQRVVDPNVLAGLYVTSEAKPQSTDVSPGVPMTFRTGSGSALTTDHGEAKEILVKLNEEFPHPSLVSSLTKNPETLHALCQILLMGYRLGLVDLLVDPPLFAKLPNERPRISRVARDQLEHGHELIASLRHSVVSIDNPMTRELLLLLDGTRDRQQLLRELPERLANNPQAIPEGQSPQSADWWREQLAPQFENGLKSAARMALLIDE